MDLLARREGFAPHLPHSYEASEPSDTVLGNIGSESGCRKACDGSYSARSAKLGSMRIARRAENDTAISEATIRRPATTANVAGS